MIQERDQQLIQAKLNASTAKKIERRREKERLKEQREAASTEQARLNSLASIGRNQELWREQEEAFARKRAMRDDASIRAGGPYKRRVGSQPAVQQPTVQQANRSTVVIQDRRSRYNYLF